MSKQMEAFEAWRQECGYDTEAFKSVLELAWQASRAAALEEAEKAVEAERLEGPIATENDLAYENAISDCLRAICALIDWE